MPRLPLLLALFAIGVFACGSCASPWSVADLPAADAAAADLAGEDGAGAADVPADPAPDPAVEPGPDAAADLAADPGADAASLDLACTPCRPDLGCPAGYRCVALAQDDACLAECDTALDCAQGFVCYAVPGAASACVPFGYNCVACLVEGCPDGQCCDFLAGTCRPCRAECAQCWYDPECGPGRWCLKPEGSPTGQCVRECPDGTCPEGGECAADDQGRRLCRPAGCYCPAPSCPAGTFPSPDCRSCWECRNPADCPAGQACDPESHECQVPCGPGLRNCSGDPARPDCRECCGDPDCLRCDIQAACGPDGTCRFDPPLDLCCNQCTEPFPVCAVVGGMPQCVQCDPLAAVDRCQELCPECSCASGSFACLDKVSGAVCSPGCGGGDACSAACSADSDCPPGPGGQTYPCWTDGWSGGFCHDPAGTCDQVSACCAWGTACVDLRPAGPGGSAPGIVGDVRGRCACDASHPCRGDAPCTGLASLCDRPDLAGRCPAGGLPDPLNVAVCGEPDALAAALRATLGFQACPAACVADGDCHGWVGSLPWCWTDGVQPGRCVDGGGRCGPGLCCLGGDCADLAAGFLCPGGACAGPAPLGGLSVCGCERDADCLLAACSDLSAVCARAPSLCPGGALPAGLPAKACVDVEALVVALGG